MGSDTHFEYLKCGIDLMYVRSQRLVFSILKVIMTMDDPSSSLKYAKDFIDYVNASPTPYHAVKSVKDKLSEKGFTELSERASWSKQLKKGGKYYVTRNGSSLIAFTVGGNFSNGNGIAVVGAHTDSPCLRIKPVSKYNNQGYIQIAVEQYGGLIAHSWFDRDLSIAGRVYVSENGKFLPKLLKIDKPLLRIPTLAIHFKRETGNKFEFNKETEFVPIAGQTANYSKDKKHSCADDPDLKLTNEEFESVQSIVQRHNESLIELIAKELKVQPRNIEDFELILFDHQKSVIGGLNDEFIFSPRLDNLTSCFCATIGLLRSVPKLDNQEGIQMISLFDHEEIGSVSAQGARSTFLPDVIRRLTRVDFSETGESVDYFHETMSKSFLVSSDMAHGIHPNYSSAYEAKNSPQLNSGPVLKINANQRYATNSAGIVLLKKIANLAKVPLQLFVIRNDSSCGSTIGPLLASKIGIKTLDLGNPQLSMHSIRETGGSFDIAYLCNLFEAFFENYVDIEENIFIENIY